ncbi:MAG: hypothetical protein RTU30_09635 [Candidatus Thorarchaeota archaeon]
MSDDIPERDEIVRSTIITIFLTAISLIIGILFWVWSATGVESPVTMLNELNSAVVPIIEVLVGVMFFLFLLTTVVNLRHYMTKLRAGWLEIIMIYLIATAIFWLMFDSGVGMATAVISLGFVAYIYMLQE